MEEDLVHGSEGRLVLTHDFVEHSGAVDDSRDALQKVEVWVEPIEIRYHGRDTETSECARRQSEDLG